MIKLAMCIRRVQLILVVKCEPLVKALQSNVLGFAIMKFCGHGYRALNDRVIWNFDVAEMCSLVKTDSENGYVKN